MRKNRVFLASCLAVILLMGLSGCRDLMGELFSTPGEYRVAQNTITKEVRVERFSSLPTPKWIVDHEWDWRHRTNASLDDAIEYVRRNNAELRERNNVRSAWKPITIKE